MREGGTDQREPQQRWLNGSREIRRRGIGAEDSWSGITRGHAQEALAKSKWRFHLQMQQPEHQPTQTSPSENSRLMQLPLGSSQAAVLLHPLPFAICSLYLPLSFLSDLLSS